MYKSTTTSIELVKKAEAAVDLHIGSSCDYIFIRVQISRIHIL